MQMRACGASRVAGKGDGLTDSHRVAPLNEALLDLPYLEVTIRPGSGEMNPSMSIMYSSTTESIGTKK